MMRLGSRDVKAGINEKPPVLTSMLPVWAKERKEPPTSRRLNHYLFIYVGELLRIKIIFPQEAYLQPNGYTPWFVHGDAFDVRNIY